MMLVLLYRLILLCKMQYAAAVIMFKWSEVSMRFLRIDQTTPMGEDFTNNRNFPRGFGLSVRENRSHNRKQLIACHMVSDIAHH